ncbi:hypothetical protein [Pseudomonas sp. G(2018)]|uniref:hypothetical protein n=1 Tax=Pseudomonas sp. G(2018) TaxID=2502242 RepID=UPI0010F43EFE|nr:hypothetical protein [Pseudomonas sp. G(2018)]
MYDYLTREQRIEVLLRRLQVEAERSKFTGEQRRRNRALLRGFRSALWASQSKLSVAELGALLREELGLPAVLGQIQPVPVGTVTEDE